MPIDLQKLEEEMEACTFDKVDLFDFYNKNWTKLTYEIIDLRKALHDIQDLVLNNRTPGSITNSLDRASIARIVDVALNGE
jgi:hypothetical protein